MSRKTYNNTLNQVEVSLAIERLLIANYPTTFTPARVDLDSIPAGYSDLGAVVEDTPVFRYGREKFVLEAGLPKTRQFERVTMVSGQFQVNLYSKSWRKLQYALGNYTAVSSATIVSSITSITSDRLTITLGGSGFSGNVCAQLVIAVSTPAFDAADAIEVKVSSITTPTIITVDEPLPSSIVAGHFVGKYTRVEQVFGSNKIRYYSILGVADFVDGSQVVHEMRKVTPSDTFEEGIRPDNAHSIPLLFDASAWEATIDGCTQQLIAKRHYFPAVDCC